MPQVQLSASQLATMQQLLRQEPVPGQPVPEQHTFELLAALVPCDLLGVDVTDLNGHSVGGMEVTCDGRRRLTLVPIEPDPCLGQQDHGGPHYLGYMHWNEHPRAAEECGVVLEGDSLAIGFRNGPDHVAQYFFHRSREPFSVEELALLWMLGPVLQRLVRERPTPQLPSSLTVTERRVLCHVAAGLNNREIAESFTIATGTVRKHLEHAYRKLGVTNRVAAIARMQGADISGSRPQGADRQIRLMAYTDPRPAAGIQGSLVPSPGGHTWNSPAVRWLSALPRSLPLASPSGPMPPPSPSTAGADTHTRRRAAGSSSTGNASR